MERLVDIIARHRSVGYEFLKVEYPRPPRLGGGKRLVITVATGQAMQYGRWSIPLMEDYAKRINSDFLCVSGDPINKTRPSFDKFMIYHCHDYEEVMVFDADIIVTKQTPNYFEVVRDGGIGLFPIERMIRDSNRYVTYKSETEILASLMKTPYVVDKFVNAGFAVGDGSSISKFFCPPEEPIPLVSGIACEQWNNICIHKHGLNVKYLPEDNHWMWIDDPNFDKFNPYSDKILHFAGMYDLLPWRERLMKMCYLMCKHQI